MANLTDSLARVGHSDALGQRLREEEGRLRTLQARQSEANSSAPVQVIPTAKAVESYLTQLFECLEKDPERGRSLLRDHFEGSPLIVTPEQDGTGARFYRVPEGSTSGPPSFTL